MVMSKDDRKKSVLTPRVETEDLENVVESST